MLRAIAQAILNFAGFIASFFVPRETINFDFIQMSVALLLIIVAALIIWFIPMLFHYKNKD